MKTRKYRVIETTTKNERLVHDVEIKGSYVSEAGWRNAAAIAAGVKRIASSGDVYRYGA